MISAMMIIITTITIMMMITTIVSIENAPLLKSLGYIFPFLWFLRHATRNLFGQCKVVACSWSAKGSHTVELKRPYQI